MINYCTSFHIYGSGPWTAVYSAAAVCLSYLRNNMAELHQFFNACWIWLWLSPALVVLQNVMYFRYSGWHHVYTYWSLWHIMYIRMQWKDSTRTITTPSIPTKFWSMIKTRNYLLWLSQWGKLCYLQLSCFGVPLLFQKFDDAVY